MFVLRSYVYLTSPEDTDNPNELYINAFCMRYFGIFSSRPLDFGQDALQRSGFMVGTCEFWSNSTATTWREGVYAVPGTRLDWGIPQNSG